METSSDLTIRHDQLKADRRRLPVYNARRSLLRQLRELRGSTAIVIGETGSGKTTQIPQVYLFFLGTSQIGCQPKRHFA